MPSISLTKDEVYCLMKYTQPILDGNNGDVHNDYEERNLLSACQKFKTALMRRWEEQDKKRLR